MIDIKVQAQVQSFRLDVETSIPTPGIIGIVGPNGSGKSTLLRAMAGVSDAKGSILYDGTQLTTMSRAERVHTVAYVAQNAKFLLLDEPTNHLDLHHQYRLMNMLEHVGNNHGTTVVLALHDLVLAARYCDTVLVMEHGHVAALGDPSETLTPELLRETFGVDASLRKADGEHSLIVHGPVINR